MTRFYVLSKERMAGGMNEVFAVTCEANLIDDIIVDIHNAGPELVTIHDRPEGSKLGKYSYIIDAEVSGGITDKQIGKICENTSIRFCGSLNAVSK